MEKAVCYSRSGSGEPEESSLTIAAQEDILKSYCNTQSLDAMLFISDDQVSGQQPLSDRLGGRDLLNLISTAGVQHVVTHNIERLFRNAIDAWQQVEKWHEDKITLHVVEMGGRSIQSEGESGVYFVSMLKGFARLERNFASERTRSVLAVKKANHFVYGATPYGYDLDGNQLIPNLEEQGIIKKVKNWRHEGWSLRKIAQELNENGIRTKQSSSSSRKSANWYASTVRYLLSNPIHETQDPQDKPDE